MTSLARIPIGDGQVVLVSTVQGLVSERARIESILFDERPTIVAIGLSPEAVAGLICYQPDPEVDPFEDLPDHEFIYGVKLKEFGEVALPAPDLLGAIQWSKDAGVPCYGIDLAEEAYETIFAKEVSAFGFLRYGHIQRKLARKPPQAPDARAFNLAWDAAMRRVKGIARVEAAREEAIAERALQLASPGDKVLLLVEAPREAGISRYLSLSRP